MSEFAENRKVLYVDDEENLLSSFKSLMRNQKIEAYTLNNSLLIEDVLKSNGPFAVVLSDQRMPGLDGVGTLQKVKEIFPDTMRVMVTGYSDLDATSRAINLGGILHYVTKPWDDNELRALVNDFVARYNTAMERRYLLGDLKLKNETLELLLQGTVTGVVKILSDVVASIGEDVAAQNVSIKKMGDTILRMTPALSESETWEINRALELFNLGLALLPPSVQLRIGREGLKAVDQIPIAKSHHILAANLLTGIPQFDGVARIILLQRKNFDGTGEPPTDNSRGKGIPLGARILKILLDLETQSTDHFRGREVLERMAKIEWIYDIELIARLLGTEDSLRYKRRDVRVPVFELCVGMVLLEDLLTKNGQLLLRKNSTLTDTTCKLLSQWGNLDPIISPVHVLLNQDETQYVHPGFVS